MEPIYQFRNGARIKGAVEAQTVGEELDRIRDKHEGLTPQTVVDESTPSDAPLHPCFTWDDAIAANEHRKAEARSIVRSVRVTYPDKEETEPAFVHIQRIETGDGEPVEGGYYERARTVASNFSLFENAWRSAQQRLAAASSALEELEKLAVERMSDQSAAQAEAVSAARAKVAEAQDLLIAQ